MFILSRRFPAFRPPDPRTRFSVVLLNAKIQVAGDAKLKRAEDVDVAAGHSKTLPFFALGPGKNRGGSPGAGFGGGKGTNGMGRTSSPGVLRLRAIKPSVCDRSAKRFAQDDGFVGKLGIQLVGYAETGKDRKSHRVSG